MWFDFYMDATQTPDTQTPDTQPTEAHPSIAEWANLHCYHCGRALQTPLDQITEDNEQTANIEHEACFN